MKKKASLTRKLFLTVVFAVIMTAVLCLPTMASNKEVSIEEGTYYIKAANGNAKGQVLYWNQDTNSEKSLQFESCGGSHADYEVWYITAHRYYKGAYSIYVYNDYTKNKYDDHRICLNNLTHDYLIKPDKVPDVFCGNHDNLDDAFVFFNDKSIANAYTNLTIYDYEQEGYYKLNRHKETKAFKHDLIYLDARNDNDSNNKLWDFIPVNYINGMSKAAPSLTAQKGGKVKINWDKLRNKVKNNKYWKNAKYVEIQYSTDKDFSKKVKTKKIKKGTVNKAKAKSSLSKLKKGKTYYIRVRLIDKKGVGSNWSKTVKVKTK